MHQEEDGCIAGHIAPDGKTVLGFHLYNAATGDFSVFATGGIHPRRCSRTSIGIPTCPGIPSIQADAAGRIYMVIHSQLGELALVCLDGNTGNPVGAVRLPLGTGPVGTHLRMFNVAPEGGLVYAKARESYVSYELFNCHP